MSTDEALVLTDDERREIEAEMTRYPTRQAVCVDAMKIVQRHRGWISDESLHDIAALLQMTVDELDGVATFYNLIFRRPVGRHVMIAMMTARMPNDDTSAALSRRGATLSSRICPTVSTCSIGSRGATARTTRITLGARFAATLPVRTTRPPP